jgi:hypothetical protein
VFACHLKEKAHYQPYGKATLYKAFLTNGRRQFPFLYYLEEVSFALALFLERAPRFSSMLPE